MNLRIKYVLPINAAILVLWGAHTWWDQHQFRRDYIDAEVKAILHLGQGLRSSVQHRVNDEAASADLALFAELIEPYAKLDIMLLDRDSRVLASTRQDRVGRIWREPGIDRVLTGTVDSSWEVDDHEHEGEQVIDASVGVRDATGRPALVVHVAKPLRSIGAARDAQLRSHLVFALALLLAVGLAVNLITYQLLLKPLRRIHRRVQEAGWSAEAEDARQGDEVQRLERGIDAMLEDIAARHDELQGALADKDQLLDELGRMRDGLADEVERIRRELSHAQSELVRSERLSLLSSLGSGLAHELRNPLHIVRGTAETAVRRHPEVASYVADIVEEVDRIERLVRELLSFASPVQVSLESVDLRQLLDRVVHRGCRARRGGARGGDACEIRVPGTAPTASVDPVLLEQAVLNLLTNACEAGGELVEIQVDPASDERIAIRVLDRGSGISADDLPHLFEPFYTRKVSGTGLGLPVVQRIAELHGGSAELKPRSGGGTEAVLYLPIQREEGRGE